MNIALLAKWLWRIETGASGLWLDVIRAKYLRGQPLAFAPKVGGGVLVLAVNYSTATGPSDRHKNCCGLEF